MASDAVTTAVVIDDHPAIVAGIEAWCAAATPPIEVVGSGATPAVAWTAPGLSADVVVFDLQLTEQVPSYLDLRRLVDAGRQVIVYSMREDRDTILTCLDLGAFAHVAKTEGNRHLVHAIHAASQNLPYTPPTMARAISTDARPDRPKLTAREIDVLVNWFACESKNMVADKLGLSARTVSSYIDRVRIRYANAGRPASTKAALVARAIQDGLVSLDEL